MREHTVSRNPGLLGDNNCMKAVKIKSNENLDVQPGCNESDSSVPYFYREITSFLLDQTAETSVHLIVFCVRKGHSSFEKYSASWSVIALLRDLNCMHLLSAR